MTLPGNYAANAFTAGILEGYNTMDALASLAFGIIVVNAIRSLGVDEPGAVAKSTVLAGLFSSLFMGLIYVLVIVMGAQSRGLFPVSANGGEALALIAAHYFGGVGALILAATVTLACLKTAVGLITSCSETFVQLFPKGPSYRVWAIGFCVISFLIANLGLDAILAYSAPVLMFLYPLSIVLILLTLCGRFFGNDPIVLRWTLGFTMAAALIDLLRALPAATQELLHTVPLVTLAETCLPLCDLGFGWVCPALVGLIIGLVLHRVHRTA